VRVEQIPLAGYDIVLRRLGQCFAAASSAAVMRRVMSSGVASVRRDATSDVVEREAGVVLVEEIAAKVSSEAYKSSP